MLRARMFRSLIIRTGIKERNIRARNITIYRDYFMVGECVRFLFTSCEGSLNERVSAANE